MSGEWIGVLDRLPPENQKVLIVYEDGKMTVAVRRQGWWLPDWCRQPNITHWMELPEAPKVTP